MTRPRTGHRNAPQLALFELPEAPRKSGREDVIPYQDGSEKLLADSLPSWLRFGTSSWTYPGWAGIVYEGSPTQNDLVRSGLKAYAANPLLRTVGIDRSYYGPLNEGDLESYVAQVPPDFPFICKVWEEVTHFVFPKHPRFGTRAGERNPNFLDPSKVFDSVLAPYAGDLASHAGPFIFEFAPMPADSRPSDAEFCSALDRLFSALPPRFQFAVELRTPTLLTPRYLAILRAHGVAHTLNFWTGMPAIGAQLNLPDILTAPFVIARVMIPPGRGYEQQRDRLAPFNAIVEPQLAMRRDIVELARRAEQSAKNSMFVLVGNKAEGSAPLTVRALAQAIATSRL